MANDTDQNIPMTAGGCRWKPSAGGGTGAFPAEDPQAGAVTGSWIYGAPIQKTGCAGSKTLPVPPDPDDPIISAGAPGPMRPGGMEAAPMTLPGMGGGGVPGQPQQMRDPVPMAAPGRPGSAQEDYQTSLRGLLDRHIGCPVAATFQVGGQTVTWQGILHTVGSDYLVLYQPDDDRYISCDLYSLKFVQLRSMKGAPYCAASPRWQGS